LGQSGLPANALASPFMTQAVWKRFSSSKNCKQPGAMDLDAIV
jgi:hypothetical protein